MRKDPADVTKSVSAELGDRMTKFAEGCYKVANIRDALQHPDFDRAQGDLIIKLARGGEFWKPLMRRTPRLTLTLGRWKTKEEAIHAVTTAGHTITDDAMAVIQNDQWTLLDEEGTYEFFDATVGDVVAATGWSSAQRPGGEAYQSGIIPLICTDEICKIVESLGFCFAPPESALAICLAISDLKPGKEALVLSESFPDTVGFESILGVYGDQNGAMVHSAYGYPSCEWGTDDRLLLCHKVEPTTSDAN